MRRLRDASEALPSELGRADGLAFALWLPSEAPARGAVVILHGAGSAKESHYDFARVLVAARIAAIAFDQRGHGESDGPMDGRALHDIAAMAALVRSRIGHPDAPLALRGSSMGGYLSLVAAEQAGADAVVAICPASGEGLRRGLAAGTLPFDFDAAALEAVWAEHDAGTAAAALEIPVLLLHAEGDEVVPVQHSRELAGRLRHPASRLIAVPGGHHRSIQHDAELQAVSLKFIARALQAAGARAGG